jgi:hypothetical protein
MYMFQFVTLIVSALTVFYTFHSSYMCKLLEKECVSLYKNGTKDKSMQVITTFVDIFPNIQRIMGHTVA